MNSLKKYLGLLKRQLIQLKKNAQFLFADKKLKFQPVFIIGCGRSGTTILGKTLSKHPSVCYLNERRDLWHTAYPEFNIWSKNVKERKLYVTRKDANEQKTNLLRKLFFREQALTKKTVLLEKLPINNFRLDFINFCFPDAKFIYLYRNGLEVAQSIAKEISNNWFGDKNIKLKLLQNFGNTFSEFKVENIETFSKFQLGLYEWRLSIEQSTNFFKELPKEKFIQLSYQELIDSTEQTISNIFDFLSLTYDKKLLEGICKDVKRKNAIVDVNKIDNATLNIGGPFLKSQLKTHSTL